MNKYLYFALGGLAVAALLWAEHRTRRRWQRKCTSCGSMKVHRCHQMVKIKGNRYQVFTFAICKSSKCRGSVTLVKSEDRTFTDLELWWRRNFHADQLKYNEELFRKAGLQKPGEGSFMLRFLNHEARFHRSYLV